MASILIIDDDISFCQMLAKTVERVGHECSYASQLKEGFQTAQQTEFDVVFLDIRMPDGNGLEFLPKLRELPSSPEVIIITGISDLNSAELAIKCGAWDYIQKGSSLQTILLPLTRAIEYHDEKKKIKPFVLDRKGIIGESERIKQCLHQVALAAQTDTSVLITGESGTGKELFAWAIHHNSRRSKKNFVIVDCASIPENLVENVLFGHEKGAFTGADQNRDGLIQQAHGGTLFLDEIGELPQSIQKSFLRVLQEHRFRPIGSTKEIASDFRLIAATNRNLNELSASSQFRNDLLYRIRSFEIELPPLRERTEDIREICIHYISNLCEKHGIETKGFSPDFFNVLSKYSWPGNVRELIHSLDRAFTVAHNEPTLYPFHLPHHIRIDLSRSNLRAATRLPEAGKKLQFEFSMENPPTFQQFSELTEKQYLKHILKSSKYHIATAIEISNLSRSRFYALLKKHDIKTPEPIN